MRLPIKRTLDRIPGGIMVVPLILGACLNTFDQLHLPLVQAGLEAIGASPTREGYFEFLRLGAVPAQGVGSFTESLFKTGALTLIALFLFCVGSQMTLEVGARSLGKGALLMAGKFIAGLSVGLALGRLFDPFEGLLGLSTIAIVAAMTNGNGGLFAGLTGQYGNRSANMNLAVFLQVDLLLGGVVLGLFTLLVSGGMMWLVLALFRFRSRIAAAAEASTAGNAAATPAAVAAAAAAAGSPNAAAFQDVMATATAQISIAVVTTALLCPVAVMLLDRWQRSRGIDPLVDA